MKLLALSDIHGHLSAVQQPRAREENSFDGLIVAGDIGGKHATKIFKILSSFECPVFYVYGNHDYSSEYDRKFGKNCHHLHMQAIEHGPFTICGFSGCPTHWGKNPIASEIQERCHEQQKWADRNFRPVIEALANASNDVSRAERAIAAKARGLDHLSSSYRAKIESLCRRHDDFKSKHAEIKASKGYQAYLAACPGNECDILKQNRQALNACVKASGTNNQRLIIVTHERFAGTAADFPAVPLFLFGHRHGFTDTVHRGSRFVNVSALDNPVALRPRHLETFKWRDCKPGNAGVYAIIEAVRSGEIKIRRCDLEVEDESWMLVTGCRYCFRYIDGWFEVAGFANPGRSSSGSDC